MSTSPEDRAVLSHPPTGTNDVGGGGTSTNDKGLDYGGTSGDAYSMPTGSRFSSASWLSRVLIGVGVLVVVLILLFTMLG